MLAISVSGLVGAALSLALAWDFGILARLLSVPIGGSLAALVCVLYVGFVRSRRARQLRRDDDTSMLARNNRAAEL